MEYDGVDPAQFPKVAAHHMMQQRKSVQNALRVEAGA